MTEDEAKTKWCPFVRAWECGGQSWVARPLTGPEDGGQMTAEKAFCMGSACMAWRWSDAKRTATFLDAVQAHMKSVPNPNFAKSTQVVYAERGREFEQTEGYCGLAGPP